MLAGKQLRTGELPEPIFVLQILEKKMKMKQLKCGLSHYYYISKLAYKATGFLLAFPFIFHAGFLVVALTLVPPPVPVSFHH